MPRRATSYLAILLIPFVWCAVIRAQQPTPGDGKSKPSPPTLPDDPATVIAVVGQSPVLLGDVIGKAEARIKEVVAQTGQQIPPDQLAIARVNLVRSALAETIQNKMMRESFLLDQVGTANADKRAEADATMAQRARQIFFESEVPELKKQYKVDDLVTLDEKLRDKGTTLASRERDFIDAMLGHLYIRSKIKEDPSVSLAEITEFYEENKDKDYHHATRARWEQLTVLFSEFSDHQTAHNAIWEMGREAYFGGNMQAVARAKSQEPLGPSGGYHDWTDQGALASDRLDQEIFSIPLNAMSEIVEDDQGYHIIRVLEREEANYVPLTEVQDEIRATIRKDKISKSRRKAIMDLRDRVPVWSWFPNDVPGAKPLPNAPAQSAGLR